VERPRGELKLCTLCGRGFRGVCLVDEQGMLSTGKMKGGYYHVPRTVNLFWVEKALIVIDTLQVCRPMTCQCCM
jgi:hypothetical protein